MLPGARGPSGPVVGDVHLVDAVEAVAGVAGQHARQPWPEAGPDGHDDPALPGLGVEIEEALHGGDAVGDGHHVPPGGHRPLGDLDVACRRRGDDDHVDGGGLDLVDRRRA
jgi:hypothetical protein